MIKYWGHLLIILLAGLLIQTFLPWWSLVVLAAVSAFFIKGEALPAFFYGFGGGFLLWGGKATFINWQNESLMSERVGELLGGISPLLLILITAVTGGLLAGLASALGALLRFRKTEHER